MPKEWFDRKDEISEMLKELISIRERFRWLNVEKIDIKVKY